MQNRVSWSLFDKIRKEQGLTDRKRDSSGASLPQAKRRKHGSNSSIDTAALLQEASEWQENEDINWSELARQHGINKPNGGQLVKEILADQGVPAALKTTRQNRAPRRSKLTTKNNVAFPMYAPVTQHKQILSQKISDGDVLLGKEISETPHFRYKVDKASKSI